VKQVTEWTGPPHSVLACVYMLRVRYCYGSLVIGLPAVSRLLLRRDGVSGAADAGGLSSSSSSFITPEGST